QSPTIDTRFAPIPEKIPLFILDSNESPALLITHYIKWVVEFPSFPSFEWDFFIIDSPKGEDLILGYDFLYHFNPIIDWENGLITYDPSHKNSSVINSYVSDDLAPAVNSFSHKDSSAINSSMSNYLATSVNSVALVGELKTPYLPSSIYIPSIIPSQSLLKSRDEVSNEIKDVSISSLDLFQGDMNLPPCLFMPPWRSSGMRSKSQKKYNH
ncbi:hypothetical protein O181_060231, partial [Austropuccinia psidii MF-1]|nr:hypothetical protein [Austropuccinia psidii MF-1]